MSTSSIATTTTDHGFRADMNWRELTGDFYCVDVGSRGGFDELRTLRPSLHVYSLDADPAAPLGSEEFASFHHFSLALHSSRGERDFFLTTHPSFSSLLEFDAQAFIRHFGLMAGSAKWARGLESQRKETTKTETADNFFRSQNVEHIDFLKLDTQGTELEILKGASEYLGEARIAVIKTEVSFVPVYRNQCTFSDIDHFLKQQGFLFVDCALYPDAIAAERGAPAIDDINLREQVRFTAGGDAFYVLHPDRYKGDDRTGSAIRSAVVLNQLGYVSVALDLLKNALLPPDQIEALLRATAPVDIKPRWKLALRNNLPPSAYNALRRLRRRLRTGA
jgi:FkbM family methyltransferase